MKNTFLSIAIAAIIIAGCNGNHPKEPEQNKDVHTHEDGSVHQDHEKDSTIIQEEFNDSVDTSIKKEKAIKDHTHGEKESHDHPHNH